MPAADSIMPLITSQFFGVRSDWMALLIFIQLIAFTLPGVVGLMLYFTMERRASRLARGFSDVTRVPAVPMSAFGSRSRVIGERISTERITDEDVGLLERDRRERPREDDTRRVA